MGRKGHNTHFHQASIFEGNDMKQIFTVTGMTCEHCEKTVARAVRQLDRAAVVQADRTSNRVEVDSDQPRDALAQAIADEGFTVAA
jgi:copper chaperone